MKLDDIPEVDLFSDGGAIPNPGKGGFGTILSYKGIQKEFSQGFRLTTNNRMELQGIIFGLEQLKKKSIVNVFTDSRYVVDGINNNWATKWRENNWFRTKTELALNHDLWEKLLILISYQEKVNFNWIKGHAGHRENERCDELSNLAIKSDTFLEDAWYEEYIYSNTGYEVIIPQLPSQEKKIIGNRSIYIKKHSKVTAEGDKCIKCGTPVIKSQTKKKEPKVSQTYYYEYYYRCPECKTFYYVEEAKKFI